MPQKTGRVYGIGSVIEVQLEQQKWSLSDHSIKRRKYTYTQVFGVCFVSSTTSYALTIGCVIRAPQIMNKL